MGFFYFITVHRLTFAIFFQTTSPFNILKLPASSEWATLYAGWYNYFV